MAPCTQRLGKARRGLPAPGVHRDAGHVSVRRGHAHAERVVGLALVEVAGILDREDGRVRRERLPGLGREELGLRWERAGRGRSRVPARRQAEADEQGGSAEKESITGASHSSALCYTAPREPSKCRALRGSRRWRRDYLGWAQPAPSEEEAPVDDFGRCPTQGRAGSAADWCPWAPLVRHRGAARRRLLRPERGRGARLSGGVAATARADHGRGRPLHRDHHGRFHGRPRHRQPRRRSPLGQAHEAAVAARVRRHRARGRGLRCRQRPLLLPSALRARGLALPGPRHGDGRALRLPPAADRPHGDVAAASRPRAGLGPALGAANDRVPVRSECAGRGRGGVPDAVGPAPVPRSDRGRLPGGRGERACRDRRDRDRTLAGADRAAGRGAGRQRRRVRRQGR